MTLTKFTINRKVGFSLFLSFQVKYKASNSFFFDIPG